jgi:hypothetical protein
LSPSGGAPRGRVSPASNSSIGSATPFSTQWPCDFSRSATAAQRFARLGVSSVWPPRASAITRAAVGLARPSTSSGLAPRATSARAVLAQHHRAHVQAGARQQRHRSAASARW